MMLMMMRMVASDAVYEYRMDEQIDLVLFSGVCCRGRKALNHFLQTICG